MRQSLEDGDNLLEMTKRVSSLEAAVARAKAEGCQLKMRLEEVKGGGEVTKPVKPKRRHLERLFLYDDNEKEATKDQEKENGDPNVLDQSLNKMTSDKKTVAENASIEGKKKKVSFSDISGSEETPKEASKEKEKSLKKPKERKYNTIINAREEAAKMEQECKQQ